MKNMCALTSPQQREVVGVFYIAKKGVGQICLMCFPQFLYNYERTGGACEDKISFHSSRFALTIQDILSSYGTLCSTASQ